MAAGQHRRLHRGHDLTGLGADHREAENAVVTFADQRLHETLSFVGRLRSQHRAHRQPRDARGDAVALRIAFAQSDPGEGRVGEHAIGNQPIARAACRAGQIVPDDPEVVDGCVRELGAPGAFPHGPDVGRTRLQPLVDANIAPTVQLNAGLLEPEPGGVRRAPRRDQDVAALDLLLAGERAHDHADVLSGSTAHLEGLGRQEEVNTFLTEDPLHRIRDVGILAAHELRAMLDDRHPAPEATVRLGQFETNIAAPEHDQMCWQVVQLQRLDMCERSGRLEAGDARNYRVRSDVDEHLVARQHAGPAVIQAHLECARGHEPPGSHDQVGAARLVVLQMVGNLGVDHVALALANRRHVDRDVTGHRTELRSVAHQMRDLRAPDLVLAGHAGDVGTGAADPPALHDGSPSARSRQMPGQ